MYSGMCICDTFLYYRFSWMSQEWEAMSHPDLAGEKIYLEWNLLLIIYGCRLSFPTLHHKHVLRNTIYQLHKFILSLASNQSLFLVLLKQNIHSATYWQYILAQLPHTGVQMIVPCNISICFLPEFSNLLPWSRPASLSTAYVFPYAVLLLPV